MDECDRSHSGQFCLPDKEFRYLRTVRLCYLEKSLEGADISAALFVSPRRPDYIIAIREIASGV